jgi:hypothetical protein
MAKGKERIVFIEPSQSLFALTKNIKSGTAEAFVFLWGM